MLSPEVLKVLTPVSHGVMGAVVIASLNTLLSDGVRAWSGDIVRFLKKLPFFSKILSVILDGEVRGAVKMLAGSDSSKSTPVIPIPEIGLSAKDIMGILDKVIIFE